MSFIRNHWEERFIEKLSENLDAFSKRAQELDEKREFPFQNIADLKELGYTKLTLPIEYGGSGKGLYEFLLGQEKIAMHCGPTALSIGWHVGITIQIQDKKRNWNEDIIKETFEKISKGALINRLATEPQTGSPTRGGKPATTATKENGHWVINGRKTFSSLAPALDLLIVSAWITEDAELGWFLIDRNTKGITINKTWDVISMQGTASEDFIFENVKIEDKYLVEKGRKDVNFDDSWLLHIPACYIGIAGAARNYAIQFATTYSPNSIKGTISELPNVQRLIGEMELELLQSRHFLYSVAAMWEAQPENHLAIKTQLGAVKKAVTNSAISIVDKAMRIVGAQSLQRNNPLQRYYRDVRAGLHNPPMDDMTLSLLAKQACQQSE
ncbi:MULTISPECIES: acyl-CoA dehydrogenase family protein [Bacillus]|uniref:acyl-CoA dehydrogenase family protein n=1 Tax=Bacillus TaxID=1386 RepID=UPI0002D441B5|nr:MULTISPECIES: acyl-CoA dehydrogenase family protein [Bacillus]